MIELNLTCDSCGQVETKPAQSFSRATENQYLPKMYSYQVLIQEPGGETMQLRSWDICAECAKQLAAYWEGYKLGKV